MRPAGARDTATEVGATGVAQGVKASLLMIRCDNARSIYCSTLSVRSKLFPIHNTDTNNTGNGTYNTGRRRLPVLVIRSGHLDPAQRGKW